MHVFGCMCVCVCVAGGGEALALPGEHYGLLALHDFFPTNFSCDPLLCVQESCLVIAPQDPNPNPNLPLPIPFSKL